MKERNWEKLYNKVRYAKGCCKEKWTNCCPGGWDERKEVCTAVRMLQNIIFVFQNDSKEALEKIWWMLKCLHKLV